MDGERRVTVCAMLLAIVLAGTGCARGRAAPKAAASPTDNPPQEEGGGPPGLPVETAWLDRQIDLYLVCTSIDYGLRCWVHPYKGNTLSLSSQQIVIGLVAERELQLHERPAIDALVRRLASRVFPPHTAAGGGDDIALLGLLWNLGTTGAKAYIALVDGGRRRGYDIEYVLKGPPLAAPDQVWLQFLKGRRDPRAETLVWQLARDRAALQALQGEAEREIGWARQGDEELMMDVTTDDWMQKVLVLAPPDGVSSAQLRRWSRESGLVGVEAAADLALARRGDADAKQRVRETIVSRFAPQEHETAGAHDFNAHYNDRAEFRFVVELGSTPLDDRWELLLGLLAHRKPELLAPRAAAVLAFEEHWAELAPHMQAHVRETFGTVQAEEGNEWLSTLMLSFLGSHPASEPLPSP